jgi:predicted GNAT superfamily acetyltransferase
MNTSGAPRGISIRDLTTLEDLRQLQMVEKEVWGMGDEDSLPMTLAIALQAVGSIFVGAFEGEKMAGFAFGMFAREHGQITIHSHMLAVLDGYRQHDLGFRLKQAQRERALALGIKEMTWTFDPLQSRNAHFNFAKLGIVSNTYKVNFYGPETSSVLHRNGTDRLWVRWLLDSKRTRDRASGKDERAETLDALRLLAPLVAFNGDGRPVRADLAESLGRQRVSIEIPGEILDVERSDMGLAREWREATRWAFTQAIGSGFYVAEFCRSIRGQQGPGAYLLEKGEVDGFVA